MKDSVIILSLVSIKLISAISRLSLSQTYKMLDDLGWSICRW